MEEILRLLEKDARFTPQQLAAMTGSTEADVEEKIKKFEDDNVILGYTALVDWEKADPDAVTALIEVKIAPQRGDGFERIAERIYQFEEVESLYLMSGSFDLTVIVNGRNLLDVSRFISENLAPMEHIISTSTHFVLKKYKDAGVDYNPEDGREDFRND